MTLKGKVKSGLGNAHFWVEKIYKIFDERFGIKLFYGTLNIELEKPYKIGDGIMQLQKDEYGGNQVVIIEACEVFNNKAFIVRTDKNESGKGDHPLTIIEIVSDINFREKYNLKDGDEIEIII